MLHIDQKVERGNTRYKRRSISSISSISISISNRNSGADPYIVVRLRRMILPMLQQYPGKPGPTFGPAN